MITEISFNQSTGTNGSNSSRQSNKIISTNKFHALLSALLHDGTWRNSLHLVIKVWIKSIPSFRGTFPPPLCGKQTEQCVVLPKLSKASHIKRVKIKSPKKLYCALNRNFVLMASHGQVSKVVCELCVCMRVCLSLCMCSDLLSRRCDSPSDENCLLSFSHESMLSSSSSIPCHSNARSKLYWFLAARDDVEGQSCHRCEH